MRKRERAACTSSGSSSEVGASRCASNGLRVKCACGTAFEIPRLGIANALCKFDYQPPYRITTGHSPSLQIPNHFCNASSKSKALPFQENTGDRHPSITAFLIGSNSTSLVLLSEISELTLQLALCHDCGPFCAGLRNDDAVNKWQHAWWASP